MSDEIIVKIKNGQVGVIPTDTVFGIVASALLPDSVSRIYREKSRPGFKPFVIIISDYDQLSLMDVELSPSMKQALEKVWPAPVSVLLPCTGESLKYLHRGTQELAIRMPKSQKLREFLGKTGPLVATSANISGIPMPDNLADIKKQLPNLDFYEDGPTGKTPSILVRLYPDGSIQELTRD